MALMPGTGFPTRPSAVYQGFLLGMFLNGAAAFGLDSILQTPAEVLSRFLLVRYIYITDMMIWLLFLAGTRCSTWNDITDIFDKLNKL